MVMERAEFSSKEVPFQDFQKQKTPKNGVTFPPPFLLGVRLDFIFLFHKRFGST